MIGQKILIQKLFHQIDNGKFPKFSILIGEQGSGKKTLANEIAQKLCAMVCVVDTKVDDIRKMIDSAYNVEDLRILYLIADSDNMSNSAANAILKVIEEPPHNAYFILTCENLENLLPTIRSRGVTYMMEPYSYEDKCDYIDSKAVTLTQKDLEFILNVSDNIGNVQSFLELVLFKGISIKDFIDYVNLVIDNIAEVSGSNAFKISEKIALKDETDKYDLKLFWRAFNSLCVDKMTDSDEPDPLRYANAVAITGEVLQQLSIRGINKQMLFDTWILRIRNEWLE